MTAPVQYFLWLEYKNIMPPLTWAVQEGDLVLLCGGQVQGLIYYGATDKLYYGWTNNRPRASLESFRTSDQGGSAWSTPDLPEAVREVIDGCGDQSIYRRDPPNGRQFVGVWESRVNGLWILQDLYGGLRLIISQADGKFTLMGLERKASNHDSLEEATLAAKEYLRENGFRAPWGHL